MPSGKKKKKTQGCDAQKKKKEREQTDTKRNSVLGYTLNIPSSLK